MGEKIKSQKDDVMHASRITNLTQLINTKEVSGIGFRTIVSSYVTPWLGLGSSSICLNFTNLLTYQQIRNFLYISCWKTWNIFSNLITDYNHGIGFYMFHVGRHGISCIYRRVKVIVGICFCLTYFLFLPHYTTPIQIVIQPNFQASFKKL